MPIKNYKYTQFVFACQGDYKKRLDEILEEEGLGFSQWIKKMIDNQNPIIVQKSKLEKGE